MAFRFELLVDGALASVARTPDLEVQRDRPLSSHDELVHILSAQCRALAATGGVLFHVGGFGQDPWPVDVETDLAVAIEQLPGVFAGLRKEGEPFEWNFYEQGIERDITGTRRDGEVRFECMSMSLRWSADPAVELVGLREAEGMFRQLRDRYTSTVERVCPWLADLPAFRRWRAAG